MKIIEIPAKLPMYLFVRAEELVDDTFGEGMFFKQTWDSSIHQWIVLEEGYYNDEIVGYCSAQIKQEGLLGILKTSVVRPDRQRHGIGDVMVKHRVKWLQEQNVQTIKSYAWFMDGRVPAQKMLMNNDFKPLDDIRGYWSSDHNAGFPCKICGSNCKCVARIFEYEK
ncbi:MAG: GNAT family N-acetyltransferase [Betaproteobacteria bacterium]